MEKKQRASNGHFQGQGSTETVETYSSEGPRRSRGAQQSLSHEHSCNISVMSSLSPAHVHNSSNLCWSWTLYLILLHDMADTEQKKKLNRHILNFLCLHTITFQQQFNWCNLKKSALLHDALNSEKAGSKRSPRSMQEKSFQILGSI